MLKREIHYEKRLANVCGESFSVLIQYGMTLRRYKQVCNDT